MEEILDAIHDDLFYERLSGCEAFQPQIATRSISTPGDDFKKDSPTIPQTSYECSRIVSL